MTFSERMIAKYGEERWEQMKKEHEEYKSREMVVITSVDKLNHSLLNYIMTGNSYKKVI